MWSTPSRNSWGKSIRANRAINDSPFESFRRGTFKRTSVEPLKRMSWLAAAIPTMRRSNDPGARSTTRGRCGGASFCERGDESDSDENIISEKRAGHPIGIIRCGNPYAHKAQPCIANCSETHLLASMLNKSWDVPEKVPVTNTESESTPENTAKPKTIASS